MLDLIVLVIKQALQDAESSNQERRQRAIEWLNDVWPEHKQAEANRQRLRRYRVNRFCE